MTISTVAEFSITYKQILNETGNVVDNLPAFATNKTDLLAMYKMMVLVRTFDSKAIALQRTGKLGTYPSILGQEAISVAIGAAMQASDVLCPYYRDIGAQFWRGVKMEEILAFWGGNEDGCNYKAGANEDFPICIPIASQTLHAVGAATAIKLRKQKRAVVAIVGEGGTSRGDFYEAMNLAGVWGLPVVFVVNNNQWAISVPRHEQTKAETIAQKGIAAGIQSCQVDGNDILVLRDTLDLALKKARETNVPMLIEALTYRIGDHTTADDARRYRDASELEANKAKDPITRFKNYLINNKYLDENTDKKIYEECVLAVAKSVDTYLNIPLRNPQEMFNYLYAALPEAYIEQFEEVLQNKVGAHG